MDFCLVGESGGVGPKVPLRRCSYTRSNNLRVLRACGEPVGLIAGFIDRSDAEILSWRTMDHELLVSELAHSSGSFACLLDCDGELVAITDHSGSIPIFCSLQDQHYVLAAKPDDVARSMQATRLDHVSIADFIANGAVCHPFTFYEGVEALAPGTISVITSENPRTTTYWEPREEGPLASLQEWGNRFRESVKEALHKPLLNVGSAHVMFSGGEDSRVLASMLPAGPRYHLLTIVDRPNRELRLAQRAASRLKLPLRTITRPPNFYRDSFQAKVRSAGSGMDVRHYHFFGPTADAATDADALVGGLGSDKLFKSLFMANVQQRHGLPERQNGSNGDTPTNVMGPDAMSWMADDLAAAVWERRCRHHERLQTIRPLTAGNWHTLWPLGGHSPGHAQYLHNLRLGPRIIEPFFSSNSYKVASALPDELRIDRKVFIAAFKEPLGLSGWIPTSSGRLPAVGGHSGRLAQIFIQRQRRLSDGLRARFAAGRLGSQGSWHADHGGFAFDLELELGLSESAFGGVMKVLDAILPPNHCSISLEQRVRVLQVACVVSDFHGQQRTGSTAMVPSADLAPA